LTLFFALDDRNAVEMQYFIRMREDKNERKAGDSLFNKLDLVLKPRMS
jgi:hypothetical protein